MYFKIFGNLPLERLVHGVGSILQQLGVFLQVRLNGSLQFAWPLCPPPCVDTVGSRALQLLIYVAQIKFGDAP